MLKVKVCGFLIKQEALVTLCFQMLELEKEELKEAQELLEKQQQHNLSQFAGLKKEIAYLQCENRSLQYVLFWVCFSLLL
jgi:FtsZ-binding cell division protein ZapB